MDVSFQVLKEPRGLIRVIQIIMAILAFSLTAGFSTECEFNIPCKEFKEDDILVKYDFEYPFEETTVLGPQKCEQQGSDALDYTLPYNYSSVASFFVATGVLSFLYCLAMLVTYICFHQTYAQNNRLPVIDLSITAVLSIFWLAGSSAWAQGVTDLKYYLHPEAVFNLLPLCINPDRKHNCQTIQEGSYGTLNASLILGFANFLLWVSSLWFVYKETVFFAEPLPEPTQNQQSKGGAKV